MKYSRPTYEGGERFRSEWSSGDDERMCLALVALTLDSGDAAGALSAILVALAGETESVRQCAVTCAGHWFRLFGRDHELDTAQVTELGHAIHRAGFQTGVIDDMLSDVRIFCPELLPAIGSSIR